MLLPNTQRESDFSVDVSCLYLTMNLYFNWSILILLYADIN